MAVVLLLEKNTLLTNQSKADGVIAIVMYKFFIFVLFICFAKNISAADPIHQQAKVRSGFYLKAFADVDRADIEVAMLFWITEIAKKANLSTSNHFYTSIEKMHQDFLRHKINFILASPLPIVKNFDPSLLTDGYKVIWDGSAEDDLLVITHKQAELHQFSELNNKHLSLLINDPVTQIYADILALEHFGKKANQVFKQVSGSKKSNQLIFNLFFKKTDVIMVYEKFYKLAIELNPQIKKDTQIISRLTNIPRALGYFHKDVDPALRSIVLLEVEKLHQYAKGQQLLDIFHADRAIRSSIADLQSTQQLIKRYQYLIKEIM
jgi:hypothetical protein